MKMARTNSEAGLTQVVVVTADPAFEELVRATFGASEQIALRVISGTLASVDGDIDAQSATVAVIDLDAAPTDDLQALERLMAGEGAGLPVVCVTRSVDANLARTLLQMRVPIGISSREHETTGHTMRLEMVRHFGWCALACPGRQSLIEFVLVLQTTSRGPKTFLYRPIWLCERFT